MEILVRPVSGLEATGGCADRAPDGVDGERNAATSGQSPQTESA